MHITITVIQPAKDSIYSRLKQKLGREPTASEIRAEISLIIRQA